MHHIHLSSLIISTLSFHNFLDELLYSLTTNIVSKDRVITLVRRVWYGVVVDESLHKHMTRNIIPFQPKLHEYVDDFLSFNGIHSNEDFLVFSWRSESIAVEKRKTCAEELIKHAQLWSDMYNMTNMPVLVSDISIVKDLYLWHSDNARQELPKTLTQLLREHFIKVESYTYGRERLSQEHHFYRDIIFLSIFDFILGEKALHFIACTDNQNRLCHRCSRWDSNYVLEIMKRRHGLNSENPKRCASSWNAINQTRCDGQLDHHEIHQQTLIHKRMTKELKQNGTFKDYKMRNKIGKRANAHLVTDVDDDDDDDGDGDDDDQHLESSNSLV